MTPEEKRRRRSLRLAQQLVLEWTEVCAIKPPFGDLRRSVESLAQWLDSGPTVLDFSAELITTPAKVQS